MQGVVKEGRRQRWLALCLSLVWMMCTSLVHSRSEFPAMAVVALQDLPAEARLTYQRIHEGGPFPYEKDGVVFGNRERILPRQPRGYYREYTVRTPGARDRGAQRIVCGGEQVQRPQACYFSSDHYASFRMIAPQH